MNTEKQTIKTKTGYATRILTRTPVKGARYPGTPAPAQFLITYGPFHPSTADGQFLGPIAAPEVL